MARKIIKSITVGVSDSTVDDFSEVAALIGAPSDAKITATGGPVYLPGSNEYDQDYPYSVNFTWVEEV